jgi:hypothetical protein
VNNADWTSKPSYKEEILPWLCGLFHGREQKSNLRVSDVCQELILALDNRLICVYRSSMLKRNEVIVKCTQRGQKILDRDTSKRISFPPEIGCDDDSLDKYYASATQVFAADLVQMCTKSSFLDDILEQFSILERN